MTTTTTTMTTMTTTMSDAGRIARRSRALFALRDWLRSADFVEADTPQLVPGPGLEPHIDPLGVDVALDLHGRHRARRYLITSPELALKRVVAAGVPRVFQLGHVFRDGERSPRHTPEFTLLEWYRGPGTLDVILDDTMALIRAMATAVGGSVSAVGGSVSAVDVMAPPERLTLTEAFARHADVDLDAAIDDTAAGDAAALARRARRAGVCFVGSDDDVSFDDAFFAIMDTRVEPAIGLHRLCALERWPATMAVLARVCDDDPRYAHRFELYGHGATGCLELCNAFDELTDPIEQRRRFEGDNAIRRALNKVQLPLDEDFLAALPHLPQPTAGNALGVDRVLMLLTGASSIDDVHALPFR